MLGNDAVSVDRKTRILFNNSYFDYPLTPLNALFGLGVSESVFIGFSYLFARVKSYLSISKINNLVPNPASQTPSCGAHLGNAPSSSAAVIGYLQWCTKEQSARFVSKCCAVFFI